MSIRFISRFVGPFYGIYYIVFNNKTFLALIIARGNSKGLPGKNLADIGGKPSIAWTIGAAQHSKYLDEVILSTDSEKIAGVARHFGCSVPFIRPAPLAEDDSSAIDVILHAIKNIGTKCDYIVLLQATSPLREAEDIDSCIETCITQDAPAALTITRSPKPSEWMYKLTSEGKLVPAINNSRNPPKRRQETHATFMLNGAVYVAKWNWLKQNKTFISTQTVGSIMPRERSVDIDDTTDLSIARHFFNTKEHKI